MCQACQATQAQEVKLVPVKEHSRLMEMFTKTSVDLSLVTEELNAANKDLLEMEKINSKAVLVTEELLLVSHTLGKELAKTRTELRNIETALRKAGVQIVMDAQGNVAVSIKLS